MPTALAILDEKTAAWQKANPEKAARNDRKADELHKAVVGLIDGTAGAGARLMDFVAENPTYGAMAVAHAITALAHVKRQQGATLTALEQRLAALEKRKELKYVGVWAGGQVYPENSATTFRGSLWVARRDTVSIPGSLDSGWQLATKCGAPGKNGRDGRDAGGPSHD